MVTVTTLASICPECGHVFQRTRKGAYCDDCRPQDDSWTLRTQTTAQRGYGKRWQRLSKKARELQPFCTDCNSPDDLTADHTVEAWRRYEAGKVIRLQDIDVVCRDCNSARGEARGDNISERRTIVDAERQARKAFLSDE